MPLIGRGIGEGAIVAVAVLVVCILSLLALLAGLACLVPIRLLERGRIRRRKSPGTSR